PGPTAPYTGMLPGFVAGHYRRDDLSIDLVQLARFANARLILGAASGIDRASRHIHVEGRAPIAYDLAAINIGITSDLPSLPGFAEHAVPAKPLGMFARRWSAFRAAVQRGEMPADIAVIGGGVGGVELALAMAHALRQDGHGAAVTIIEKGRALPGLGPRARAALLDRLTGLGVVLIEGAEPRRILHDAVQLGEDRVVAARLTVGTAGARPQGWLAGTGLDLAGGFISVDRQLRSSDHAIYATGDCAHLPDPRPKAGVFAVREAPVLLHNLRAALGGGKPRSYAPQRDYLKLISLGGKSAVADKFGLRLQGAWLWRWKDRIDRKFMRKFTDLPPMPAPALPRRVADGVIEALGTKPACGGCGAKVGGETLAGVLATLPEPGRADIRNGPGDDAAILRVGGTEQVFTTDHLRAFTEDPFVMARIAAVHALGDIWAMGAAPQAALAHVILPPMSARMQGDWLQEIMAAASQVFASAGAAIAGGHTSTGAELTIGFSVTGLLDGPAITLAAARPGDALILTKAIGSGTILAGEMARRARGDWVAEALLAMSVPQGAAAGILTTAHAMTDVTGFGLAGHLMGICRASGVAARLNLDAIPLMTGALDLARAGVRSSLYDENRKTAAAMALPDDPRADLLFDPQTAGGLLAAVAPDRAAACLQALQKAGITAAHIGGITEGSPFISVDYSVSRLT
ncbi:MAG: selenide, water dikinase SelD, partial [Rhodobacter sp.]|nr:selenide, water dikinase SelD [Rhodobacter sp.]